MTPKPAAHTPIPWKIANNKGMDFPMIVTPEKEQPKYAIAEVYPTSGQFDEKNDFFALGNALENAAFIVRAVNSHEELLRTAKAVMDIYYDRELQDEYLNGPMSQLCDAIAKAEGRS